MLTNIQDILGIYSQFANITFEWKGNYDSNPPGSDSTPNSRDVGQASLSDININWIYRSDNGFAGVSGANSDNLLGYIGAAGDIFLNQFASKFEGDYTLELNTRARQTLEHELGHSLGLSHPHSAYNNSTGVPTITADYSATKDLGFDQLGFRTSSAADMYKEYFSIMTYDDQQSFLPESSSSFHAHTPMILDVIALQQAYGEGTGTSGVGNDTIAAGTAGYRTYFDKGGIDTIDLSLYVDGAYLQMGVDITGAGHKVGLSMSTYDAQNTILLGQDPAHLRWFYGEYENANGSLKDDILIGNSLENVIRGEGGEDYIVGGIGADALNGGDGNDTLEGGEGDDTFDWDSSQRAGDDEMYGGDGNDTYVIDSLSDVVVELPGEGVDLIWSGQTYSLTSLDFVENISLFGTTAANITGNDNSFGNTLRGNVADNTIDGRAGYDTLVGGLGNDILFGGAGSDTAIFSGARNQYALASTPAGWTLVGPDGSDSLYGIEFASFTDQSIYLDDYAGGISTTGRLTTAGPVDGLIGTEDDQDWFKIHLTAGIAYTFNQVQTPQAEIYNLDSYLRLLSASGQEITADDDSGGNRNASISYTPVLSGDYYLSAEANSWTIWGTRTGSYLLTVVFGQAPVVATRLPDLIWTEGSSLAYTVPAGTFSDPDGDSLAYSVGLSTGGTWPSWLSFNTSTHRFIGIAPTNSIDYSVRVTVTDSGGNSTFDDVMFFTPTASNVAPVNTLPVARTIAEDTALTFTGANTISVNDADGNIASTQLTVSHGTLTVSLAGGATIGAGGGASATLKLLGTQAQINAALGTLSYQAVADYNGADTLMVLSADSGGTPLSDTDTVPITVSAVADIVADTLTTNQSTAITVNLIVGTSGASADNFEDAGRTLTSVTQAGHGTVTSTTLGAVTYTPATNFSGADSFTYTVTSGGVTETATVMVNVNAVNASTFNTVSATSVISFPHDHDWFKVELTKDVVYSFALEGDYAGQGTLGWEDYVVPSLALRSSTGELIQTAGLGPIQGTPGSANYDYADPVMSFRPASTGTYFLDAGATNEVSTGTYKISATTVSVTSTDLLDNTATTGILTVSALPGGPVSATSVISFPHDHDWFKVELTKDVVYSFALEGDYAGQGTLGWEDYVVPSLALRSSTGDLIQTAGLGSIQGTPGSANYDYADPVMSFRPASTGTYFLDAGATNEVSTGTYKISATTVSVTSTDLLDNIFTTGILNLSAGNDPPVNTVTGARTVPEDTPFTFAGADTISVNDADGNLASSDLTVGHGTLTVNLSGGATISAGANGSASLKLTGSQTQINAALGSLSYQGLVDYYGTDTLTLLSTDSVGSARAVVVPIIVNPVGDIVADTLSTNEDTAITANLITATSGASADTFEDAGRTLTSVTQGASGAVTFTGAGLVTYTPNPNFNGADSFTYTVTSGGVTETATVTVNASAVNDAPVNTVPGGQTVAQNANLTIAGIGIVDVDATTLQVTVSVVHGVLTLSSSIGLVFITGDGTSDPSMSFSGTQSAINSVLTNLIYRGVQNYVGPDAITFTTSDLGATGLGGTLTDIDTIGLTVTAGVNVNSPGVVSITGTAIQGQTLTSMVSDADGLVTLSYQWKANGIAIGGATASNLVLSQAQVGKTITVTASYTDGHGTAESATSNATSTVANVNDAPMVTSGATGMVAENSVINSVVYTATAMDPDGDTLTYSLSGTDAALLTINSSTGAVTLKGIADFELKSSYSFDVVATDPGSFTSTKAVVVPVIDVNEAPMLIHPLLNQNAATNSAFNYMLHGFLDPEAGALTYTAIKLDGSALPTWLQFNGTTGTFSGTPTANDIGTLAVHVTAKDSGNLSLASDFNISVSNNPPPTVSAKTTATVNSGSAFSFALSSLFADTETLSYQITGGALPAGLNLSNGAISGTVLAANVSMPSVVTLQATDSIGQTASTALKLYMSEMGAIIANKPTRSGNTLTIGLLVDETKDPNGNGMDSFNATIGYDASKLHYLSSAGFGTGAFFQAGAAVESGGSGSIEVAWFSTTPLTGHLAKAISISFTVLQEGDFKLDITPTDFDSVNLSSQATHVWLGTVVNNPPTVANPIADRSTAEDSLFSFVVPANTFADIDAGDTITYSATRADGSALPAWLSFSAGSRTFNGTPANADVGVLNVRVIGTDSANATASEDFALTVTNINDAPTVANPIADRSTNEDALFSFAVPSNTFADVDAGDSLSYTATKTDGSALPAWLGFNAATRTFTGTPVNADVGVVNVRVTAKDTSNASASEDFALTVVNTNDAPVAGSYANQTAGPGMAVSLNLGSLFSDVDVGDTLSFAALGLPSGLAINAISGLISGTAPVVTGVHHVTVTATDTHAASASLAFDLNITGYPVTASVVTRGGLALPGVMAHELVSATLAGSLYGFKNMNVDTLLKTFTADFVATGSGDGSLGLTFHAGSGANFQNFDLTGLVSAANGWTILTNTGVPNTFEFGAIKIGAPIAADSVIGKLTLGLPSSGVDSNILSLTNAELATSSPNRGLSYSKLNLGSSGQFSTTLPDSNLGLSFERGTADYLINGVTKPVTAADALDALKLSVGLAASKGSSWKEIISADINHDGRVTAADALEILKVSVGVNTIQPSWVFVPNDSGTNPNLGSMTRTTVAYKDDLNLASITGATSATITGILVGDVNNSWLIPA